MSNSGFVRGFIAATFAALALAFAASQPTLAREAPQSQTADAPALWKIDGPNGDVYLFGSVHLLPDGVNWRTPALDAALKDAQVVVFELDLDDAHDPAAMQERIEKLGLLPQGRTLLDLLAPEQRARCERVAALIGLPIPNLEPLRPWLAAITLGVQWIVSKGYDPNSGVDEEVWRWGKASGKQLAHLETAEEQLGVFAGLTHEQEIEFLIVTLNQIEEIPTMLDDMVQAWRKGDTQTLDKVLNADMDDFPVLRDRLLRHRHAKWLPQIEHMIADGRTHVIVVGAAHLVGKDSIIAMLRAKGVNVEGP